MAKQGGQTGPIFHQELDFLSDCFDWGFIKISLVEIVVQITWKGLLRMAKICKRDPNSLFVASLLCDWLNSRNYNQVLFGPIKFWYITDHVNHMPHFMVKIRKRDCLHSVAIG